MRKLNTLLITLFIAVSVPSQAQGQFLDNLISVLAKSVPSKEKSLKKMGSTRGEALPQQNLKLLVWNIHKADDARWSGDFARMVKDKDLVLLQEAHFSARMEDALWAQAGFRWDGAVSFRMNYDGFIDTGVVTGTKANPTNIDFIRTAVREPVLKTPKVSLFTTYRITNSNKRLLVVNVHAINFVTVLEFYIEMKRIERKIKKHDGPVIMAGDFNTWAPGRERVLNKITKRLNLKFIPFPNGTRTTGLGRELDHVFVRGFTYRKSIVHVGVESSDHKALEVILDLE